MYDNTSRRVVLWWLTREEKGKRMGALREPERIKALKLLEKHVPTEEAKRRIRQAFIRKAFRQEPIFAFPYDEAHIEWTTGSVKIPRKRERFCPTFSRTEFIAYFLQETPMLAMKEGAPVSLTRGFDPGIVSQIENTVTDLRHADFNTFERHIKKLSRLLHSADLDGITRELVEGIDLDAWLQAGYSTSGMTGSSRLEWPSETEKELGTVVLLIDWFSQNPNQVPGFARTFYYDGTNNISSTVRNMTEQMIVPFSRDYISHVKQKTGTAAGGLQPARSGESPRKAFVVHGHDEGAREAVARFLERIGFEAIIFNEQASQGLTIIEKIEAHGNVGFAVVLRTPDDVGSVKEGNLQPRARQNVLLELGYFVGRLGRGCVCALKRGDLEIPSDFGGVVYEPFDQSGGWKIALGRELKAAGFDINWNKVHQ
jgi:predicted nucleotide-binding protein